MNSKIELVLKKVAEEQGFRDFKITSSSIKGNGFLSAITEVVIIGKEPKRSIKCIVKGASSSEAFRSDLPVEKSFETEILAYVTILPAFKSFELEKLGTFSTFAPKCFATLSDSYSEGLILENLSDSYKLHPVGCTIDGEHVKLVLEQYGRFHAISFALRDQEPVKFDKMTNMENFYLPTVFKFKESWLNMYEKALLAFDVEKDSKVIAKYKDFVANLDDLFNELMNINTEKYCTILHGDSWTNNMLFTYNDENDATKPTDVRFIDFQMSRIGFPMVDLANFIYCSCSQEVVDLLDDYLLNFYYESFSKHLKKLGSDPEVLYPFDILKEQWRMYAKINLLMFPSMIGLGSTKSDERPDLEDLSESNSNFQSAFDLDISNVSVFNDRIRHCVYHFDRNGYL